VISKSERKRRRLALQELGERLVGLDENDLASLSLDERLTDAIRAASAIKSREALRRQKQLIGKLMGDVDPEPVEVALRRLNAADLRARQLFGQAERWRNRLIEQGTEALLAFEEVAGTADDELYRLVSRYQTAFGDRAKKTLRREIFGRVHEILGKIPQ